ncbi:LacI family DNA-binding transcriptional regulator [Paenibacillus sp. FSL H8-0034]|uniref:LacI family DNA-binding transcriptional regulator n=1 Tax=Paenibacillus sp. FSL H8-0034 TaxID=2954671 RepID=UPI0030FAB4FF
MEELAKITIKEVSIRAGVSISAVSMVINQKKGIGEETRQRVLKAIEDLNYTPNRFAQGLITNKTNMINVVIAANEYNDLINPFFIEIINQVSFHLQATPYKLLLNVIRQKDEEAYYRSELEQPSADGYLICGSRLESDFFVPYMREQELPLLIINRQLVPEPLSSVSPDNFKGSYLITRHLIDLGHKDIAFIGKMNKVNAPELREQGYCYAMKESGLTVREEWIMASSYDQKSGYDGFLQLWKRCLAEGKCPSAVVAGNDSTALGVIEAARELGLRIPEDLSLTGFDGIPNLHLLDPPLTTIQIDFKDMGLKIVEKITKMLNGLTQPEQILVGVQVKERRSALLLPQS